MAISDQGKCRGQIPDPKVRLPVLGNLLDIDLHDSLASLMRIGKKYAPISTMEIGGRREILFRSGDLLDELCDETRFYKLVTGGVDKLRPLAGANGHFTAQHGNEDWGIAHRILMPLFGPLKIRDMFPDMQDVSEQLCLKCMSAALVKTEKQSMVPDFVVSLRVRALAAYRKHVVSMRALCHELIQDRRKNPAQDPKTGSKMSDESIVQNLITFLIADHEPTSGLLSFVFYYLLENPSASNLTVDHLAKLPYISMIFRETLRLTPAAPGYYVTAFKDEIIGCEYYVSANELLFCFLHLIHRDPQVWGSDADEFRPESMADEFFNILPKNAWKAFGNGMRGCIGKEFAWQEAQVITIMILQNFDLSKAGPTPSDIPACPDYSDDDHADDCKISSYRRGHAFEVIL
ncbi:cytochrome P450 [Fusarium oxysporum]|nr:cytochrome P450 [Fusarium oxysporum]